MSDRMKCDCGREVYSEFDIPGGLRLYFHVDDDTPALLGVECVAGVADSENRSTPREQVRAILIGRRRWVLDRTADLEETLDEIDAAYAVHGVETR